MTVSPTLKWLGLALLGILIAVAVSIAASRLASREIGLASEPISAGDALVPSDFRKPTRRARHRGASTNRASENTDAAPTPTTPQGSELDTTGGTDNSPSSDSTEPTTTTDDQRGDGSGPDTKAPESATPVGSSPAPPRSTTPAAPAAAAPPGEAEVEIEDEDD